MLFSNSTIRQREWAYHRWLQDIENELEEGYTVEETRYGCAIYNKDGEIVDEYDYDTENEAAVRY